MSQKHKAKIQKLFEHPIATNIDEKRLLSALEHYGASVEITKHNKAKILLKDKEFSLVMSHRNSLSKDEVVRLRHFLESVDIVPDKI